MRVLCEFSAEEPVALPTHFFQQIAEETLSALASPALSQKTILLTAVSISEERIQELNRAYRGKDAVTDILSFGEYTAKSEVENAAGTEISLGELYFSPAFIGRAAEEDGVTLEHEMAYVFSHGVLHLLGYDHSEEMFSLQDGVTEKIARASLDSQA